MGQDQACAWMGRAVHLSDAAPPPQPSPRCLHAPRPRACASWPCAPPAAATCCSSRLWLSGVPSSARSASSATARLSWPSWKLCGGPGCRAGFGEWSGTRQPSGDSAMQARGLFRRRWLPTRPGPLDSPATPLHPRACSSRSVLLPRPAPRSKGSPGSGLAPRAGTVGRGRHQSVWAAASWGCLLLLLPLPPAPLPPEHTCHRHPFATSLPTTHLPLWPEPRVPAPSRPQESAPPPHRCRQAAPRPAAPQQAPTPPHPAALRAGRRQGPLPRPRAPRLRLRLAPRRPPLLPLPLRPPPRAAPPPPRHWAAATPPCARAPPRAGCPPLRRWPARRQGA